MLKKRILLAALLLLSFASGAKELKVLMIGNSFSVCVGKNLPGIVHKEKDSILLCSATIGGCSLQRHWDNIRKAEKNPNFKPYTVIVWRSGEKEVRKEKNNVNSLLKAEKWDIVTIQQASSYSRDFQSYEKPGAELIACIRKHAPQAKIYLQQTWSYRCDDSRLAKWKIDNKKMYQDLKEAYARFAAIHKLPVIPMGDAVALYREKSSVKFTPYKGKRIAKQKGPLPSRKGDPVGRYFWHKDKKTGNFRIRHDACHLNSEGEYMQGALWYGILYGKDPAKITYTPEKMDEKEASFLRSCASEAWKKYK